jgi:hypothetical protein
LEGFSLSSAPILHWNAMPAAPEQLRNNDAETLIAAGLNLAGQSDLDMCKSIRRAKRMHKLV